MSQTPDELLDQAQACHDDDPPRAADLLRRLDPASLPPERRPGLAFLLNHVLGEKLGAWPEAHALFGPLLRTAGETPPLALWRQAATAARMAGDAAAAARLSDALAVAAGTSVGHARDVVAFSATMYRTPTLASVAAVDELALAAGAFDSPAWQSANPLDSAVAACANNIASGLLERPSAELQTVPLRTTLDATACLAERYWLRAGTWVHHERAAYLRAMVANALGDAPQARDHALRALALLDEHDADRAEQVDRAFIELERARAGRDMGLHDEAQVAQDLADGLAAQFNDAGLDEWFTRRRAELGAPLRRGA